MSEEIKKSVKKIADYLKDKGFKKKSLTWNKEKKEFILLIDLQKSVWSPEYYVNVGIMLDKDSQESFKTHRCDIRYRVSYLDKYNNYVDLFKVEDEYDDIIRFIQKQVIDEFNNLDTIEDIKKKVLMDKKKKYLVMMTAKEKFGIKE